MTVPKNWLLPEHIEDVLPAEARTIERLRRAILDLFETHGYELVAPPLLEYVESLLSGTGRDMDLATFKLVDRLSGRMMGVRADHTPQVARIDAHLLNRKGVARLCYCGSVLHTVPAGMTKMREPIQIGAELYGHAGLEADIEIVRLMVESLERAGLERIHIDIGNPAIYRALAAHMDGDGAEALFNAVQQKDAVAAGDLAVLTTLNGGIDVIERARRELPAAVSPALDSLEHLARAVSAPGVEISVDLAELGGFNYESGLVFAAFTPGCPDAIARGGRYDEVGASFGRARPATGFTMDLRQLASMSPPALGEGRREGAVLAPCLEDAELQRAIDELRKRGEIVIVDLPGHDAAELGCKRMLVKRNGRWEAT
ncbi:MAG TPA: ATP phosphoribosyltransferase regulatory subunit [Usitatibacter sp.]|nr:ATP phosphoribosyltransferase regulatory subunit [Usitatibacter sp.]